MRPCWIANLVACLFTAAYGASTPAQIPLARHHVATNRTVSPALFKDLEELSRIVDIAYCVGGFGLGIEKPFECPSRCHDFKTFELVTVSFLDICLFWLCMLTLPRRPGILVPSCRIRVASSPFHIHLPLHESLLPFVAHIP